MKIIQLLQLVNDHVWQGRILGLGDDGVTYEVGKSGRWEELIPRDIEACRSEVVESFISDLARKTPADYPVTAIISRARGLVRDD